MSSRYAHVADVVARMLDEMGLTAVAASHKRECTKVPNSPGVSGIGARMLKLSEEHAAVFKDLEERDRAIQGTVNRFMTEVAAVQRQINAEAQAHWKVVMETHGIEGNWRYQDGKLFPVMPPEGAPVAQAPQAAV